jgi:hypothetical protein
MDRCFVVVSGLPGSGKSTLARTLAAALGLPLLDKDDILERLFESKGVGDVDWRRTLSRESDRILETEALASRGAVLVSHWQLPGMPRDPGTPTHWLEDRSAKVVHSIAAVTRNSRPSVSFSGSVTPDIWTAKNRFRRSGLALRKWPVSGGSELNRLCMWIPRGR